MIDIDMIFIDRKRECLPARMNIIKDKRKIVYDHSKSLAQRIGLCHYRTAVGR